MLYPSNRKMEGMVFAGKLLITNVKGCVKTLLKKPLKNGVKYQNGRLVEREKDFSVENRLINREKNRNLDSGQ